MNDVTYFKSCVTLIRIKEPTFVLSMYELDNRVKEIRDKKLLFYALYLITFNEFNDY